MTANVFVLVMCIVHGQTAIGIYIHSINIQILCQHIIILYRYTSSVPTDYNTSIGTT